MGVNQSQPQPAFPEQIEPVNLQNRAEEFPEVPPTVWSKIETAPSFKTDTEEGPPEEALFEHFYNQTALAYYEDAVDNGNIAGQQVLGLFKQWKPFVDIFVRAAMRGPDVENGLGATLDLDPEGSSQAYIRPLRSDSFSNATYEQTPTTTGQFNIVPDDTQADGAVETATADEQAWLIFGYIEYESGTNVPYDYIQEDVSDALGVRRELPSKYNVGSHDTIRVINRTRGPVPVLPGNELDVDVDVHTTGVDVGLWPVGIEVIVESATEFGGVLD